MGIDPKPAASSDHVLSPGCRLAGAPSASSRALSPGSDQNSISNPERLPVKAGPVPDKLTIRPVDDGRYGLDATFQGASGYEPAEHHQQELQRRDVPHSFRAGARRRMDAPVRTFPGHRCGGSSVGVRVLSSPQSHADLWHPPQLMAAVSGAGDRVAGIELTGTAALGFSSLRHRGCDEVVRMSRADAPGRFLWLRYAYAGGDSLRPDVLDTEWVGVFRKTGADGRADYCVEHLHKDFNEIRPDELFPTEAEAQAHAEVEYGLSGEDWRAGRAADARG